MAVRAPDFRPELDWINTGGRRLSLADFRGRVLVLDFWTYGCVNCLHVVPELHEVERSFPADELAVVGVHSGKFVNERDTANVARACERLGVSHPVVNDRQFRTWREYAVRAWPTLVVVSPDGYVVGRHSGEFTAERLVPELRQVVEEARAAGRLGGAAPLPPGTEPMPPRPGVLRFPAKVHAAADGRVFVADTGHHRVLEVEVAPDGRSGRVLRSFGGGRAGWADGPAGEAAFRAPHGMALADGTLYVADTGNHLVRAVELDGGRVATVAGTGAQARRREAGGSALETPLSSPWDLLWKDGALYAAMAGSHQLWRVEPGAAVAAPWAGSGAEELYDGPLALAALAQPSGLATDGERVYFADAEASAVRWAVPGGETGTVVGTGLFDFGDRDGAGDDVRLQHALGVAWWAVERALLVADTYNHRVKRVDPVTCEARSLAGCGGPGLVDGPAEEARFWEPGGIAVAPDGARAYVADTNNHALRAVELRTGRVATVELRP
ncbi:MAG TPA: thioredoxin-like domain-containing protein [Longimicrobiaceae bacterium]|nr:thioredoxin-like domain-containing protein [Longimicrobiaceae bacterium]